MPVSRLRPNHTGQSTRTGIDVTSTAGRLLYGTILVDKPWTPPMNMVIEREMRQNARRLRMRGERWLPAGPKSREAQRRTRQKLVQHPSVEARFPKANPAEVEAVIAEVEAPKRKRAPKKAVAQ